jgi:hypothetical protein
MPSSHAPVKKEKASPHSHRKAAQNVQSRKLRELEANSKAKSPLSKPKSPLMEAELSNPELYAKLGAGTQDYIAKLESKKHDLEAKFTRWAELEEIKALE